MDRIITRVFLFVRTAVTQTGLTPTQISLLSVNRAAQTFSPRKKQLRSHSALQLLHEKAAFRYTQIHVELRALDKYYCLNLAVNQGGDTNYVAHQAQLTKRKKDHTDYYNQSTNTPNVILNHICIQHYLKILRTI